MPGLLGLLDLIAAPSPEQARGLLSDLVAAPRNRLRGLLDNPVGFATDALQEGLFGPPEVRSARDKFWNKEPMTEAEKQAYTNQLLNMGMALGTVSKFPARGKFIKDQLLNEKDLAHKAEMLYDQFPWASHKTGESYANTWANSARDQMRDIAEARKILSQYEKTGVMPKDPSALDFLERPPAHEYASWLRDSISRSETRLGDYQSRTKKAIDEWTRLVRENPDIARQAGIITD